MTFQPKDIERFWSKVDRSGGPAACWPWTGGTVKGYGRFCVRREPVMRAHRVAFFVTHGRWPGDNACHTCDNPPCCNPAHLFEGTHTENMADREAKGRNVVRSGERNGSAKLTDQQVRDIRANYALCRVTQTELARRFGVTQAQVSLIVRGESRA